MTTKEKIYDLKNLKKGKLDTAKALVMDGKLDSDEYKAAMEEVDKYAAQIKALEDIEAQEDGESGEASTSKGLHSLAGRGSDDDGESGSKNSIKAFADAARAGFPTTKAAGDMAQEGVDADGGYTVPDDIVTRVEQFRDSKASLRDLVGVETVTTRKGRRTYKKRVQQTGFVKVAEGGKIPKKATPQFAVIAYDIAKYAGFLPITNELLEDSDENITNTMVEWMGNEARVTDNVNIRAAINKKAAVDLVDLDGLKKAVIVDLDAAFRTTCRIVTNANGLFWLSTLKDANNRDLLTPIPSEPGKMQLACGPVVVPVVDYPNADLPNNGTKIPFIVGDLVEGIRLFDRKQLTLTSSDVAVAGDFNAFEQDMTLTKGVLRQDVQQRDSDAYINGYIDTAAAEAVEPSEP